MSTADVLNAEGEFAADSFLSSAEQTAAQKLTDALKTELAEEGEAASVAAAFVEGMIGGEAAISALAGGAGLMAAADAGVAAATAAEASTALAIGPAAPMAVALFALPEILVALWGAHGGVGCCGDPPDPTPWPIVNGIPMPPSTGIVKDFPSLVKGYETKAQAAARALQEAKSANANSSCNGNGDWTSYAAAPKGSFQEYAYALIRGAVDEAQLFKCWPIAKVNFAKLLAMGLSSWNATHTGPTSRIGVTIGQGAGKDPLTYALEQAVPSTGTMEVPTGQTTGFTEDSIPTWGGLPFKMVFLKVNTGPVIPTGALMKPIELVSAAKSAVTKGTTTVAANLANIIKIGPSDAGSITGSKAYDAAYAKQNPAWAQAHAAQLAAEGISVPATTTGLAMKLGLAQTPSNPSSAPGMTIAGIPAKTIGITALGAGILGAVGKFAGWW